MSDNYISASNLLKLFKQRDKIFSLDVQNIGNKMHKTESSLATAYRSAMDKVCENNNVLPMFEIFGRNIDYKKLNDLIHSQFYNPNVLKTMSCIIHSMLSNESGFRDMIHDVKIYTDKDKENLIIFFSSLLNDGKKVIALKYEQEETLHEGIVGLLCGNKLREILPTFVWTYGFTKCDLPVFVQNKQKYEMVSACKDNQYIGLITEFVDGQSIYDYFDSKVSKKEFISILLVILYSLKYANELYQFVHWDLHYTNVILRKLDSEDHYIYLPNQNKYLWTGDKLPTIIDYGNSSFRYKNSTLANYTRADLGIRPDLTSSPMNDILKLFSSLFIKVKGNPELYPLFIKIYANLTGVINKQQVEKVMDVLDDNFDYFPNFDQKNVVENALFVSIDEFIQFVESLHPDLISNIKPNNVLSCSKHKCLSQDEIVDSIFSRTEIQTVSEFLRVFNVKSVTSEQKKYIDLFLDTVVNDVEKKLASFSKRNSPSARDVVIFDQLYYIVEDLKKIMSGLSKISGIDQEKIKSLFKRGKEMLSMYQKSALQHLEDTDFILTPDQRKRFMERQIDQINKI